MISDLTTRPETRACPIASTTPIYLVLNGGTVCYNYGTNLNELPTYVHLNQFFLFLFPDMNSVFIISFFVLNSFLVLMFFEYNVSLVRQLLRGLSYLFLFNLILFSIWLLTINTSSKQIVHLTEFVSSYLDRLLVWFRYIIMYNDTTRFLTAALRLIFLKYFTHFT